MSATLEVDFDADAAYLELSETEIKETREVTPSVLVDLDEHGVVVGIEVLSLDAEIPRSKLMARVSPSFRGSSRLPTGRPQRHLVRA